MAPKDPTPSYSPSVPTTQQQTKSKSPPHHVEANQSLHQRQAVKLSTLQSVALASIVLSCIISTGMLIGILAMAVKLGSTVSKDVSGYAEGTAWLRTGQWVSN